MKHLLLFVSFIFSVNLLHAQQFPSAKNAKLTYKIISAESNTWGYDIYNNDKLFVHQPSIPAMPGNKGFEKKSYAEKVAKKVIEKIQHGETPPTLSVEEMKEMGVIPNNK